MTAYETITTVGGQGEIRLSGVPFQPGTEVEVVVSPKTTDGETTAGDDQRLVALLSALDHAHNTDAVGALKRDELHDRDILR